MKFYWLLLWVLCAWRITHLLQAEDGPWDLVVRLRGRAGSGFWGRVLDCFQCLSLWVAAPLAWLAGDTWGERLLLWPALSAGAILLERITHREAAPPAAWFEEREEETDVLLRPAPGAAERQSAEPPRE
ncbi:MAG: hypothetical protein IT158_18310 [Bryobacterales bacterium]|nr:hypothetical protein [Bryobacterales bacterium]